MPGSDEVENIDPTSIEQQPVLTDADKAAMEAQRGGPAARARYEATLREVELVRIEARGLLAFDIEPLPWEGKHDVVRGGKPQPIYEDPEAVALVEESIRQSFLVLNRARTELGEFPGEQEYTSETMRKEVETARREWAMHEGIHDGASVVKTGPVGEHSPIGSHEFLDDAHEQLEMDEE